MKKIVFAATMLLPSVALAHPGHSHVGMSPYHHIFEGAAILALAGGAYFVARFLTAKLSRNKL